MHISYHRKELKTGCRTLQMLNYVDPTKFGEQVTNAAQNRILTQCDVSTDVVLSSIKLSKWQIFVRLGDVHQLGMNTWIRLRMIRIEAEFWFFRLSK